MGSLITDLKSSGYDDLFQLKVHISLVEKPLSE